MSHLYIHVPWCVKKCPYCDFNSHEGDATALAADYLKALIADFKYELQAFPRQDQTPIATIFIGGGTPSLMPGAWYQALFKALQALMPFEASIEITMEANPGTLEHHRFSDYLAAGINRLSIGVQSFDAKQLETLGRIHSAEEAKSVFLKARQAGFKRINLDLMFGLPDQTLAQGLDDLQQAIDLQADHISWYQLTIEPNTVFYSKPPSLNDETTADLWEAGLALLASKGFQHYEVSAFAKADPAFPAASGKHQPQACRHNLAYWQFKDYMAIGAGAHGKYTNKGEVLRYNKTKMPKAYLSRVQRLPTQEKPHPFIGQQSVLTPETLYIEFLLNRLRLFQPLSRAEYELNTGQAWGAFIKKIEPFIRKGCFVVESQEVESQEVESQEVESQEVVYLTPQGQQFLDDVLVALM